ncbi:MAG: anaerobic ribonucleoside-triphosphate reductase activating protein [Euryarchaeota archaeon]|nr:anaerobic ribonucleoside-triphosphate reductase activating protein [Euryarchaeota archaeon]
MQIKGVLETSFVDWDGNIVSTVFLPSCNFRCGFCHNHRLVLEPESFEDVPLEYLFGFWRRNSDFLDGVCITGGEPTLHRDLPELCKAIKQLGLKVKLDTNGSNPEMLRFLIEEKLVDYIAMDVKAPLRREDYSRIAGVELNGGLRRIQESIDVIITSGIDHEFRTTVIKGVHREEEVEAIARSLQGARRYVLQKFVPHLALSEELKKLPMHSDEEMDALVEAAKRYVPNAKWRGK